MPSSHRHYPHLGEPPGLTERAARAWRRRHTWFIRRGEAILSKVLAAPPPCFTEKEWPAYLSTLPLDGWILPDSPPQVQNEKPRELLTRQARATRAAACSDCMLARQMEAEEAGACRPPKYAITPRNCRQPIRGPEGCPDHGRYCMSAVRHALGTEDGTHDIAPRRGAQPPHVRIEKGLPE